MDIKLPRPYIVVDPVSGVAGDMWLGALVDLGVPWEKLVQAVSDMGLNGYTLEHESVHSKGIKATRVTVGLDNSPQPHRHLYDVVNIIRQAALSETVKANAIRVFTRLAESEAKVHGCTVEKVHFHEVGAIDAIIDIVGTCWALDYLNVEDIFVLPLPLGSGTIHCAHGEIPVPAPATADLVKEFPVSFGSGRGELVTPTGAAICTTLGKPLYSQENLGARCIQKIGYGAGKRPAQDKPNVLRLFLTNSEIAGASVANDHLSWEDIDVLETSVDDMNPQWISRLMSRLLSAGALDVQVTSTMMKKERLGHHLTILCSPTHRLPLMEILFAETTTLGIRCRREQRACLSRDWVKLGTCFGDIRIKRGFLGERIINIQPEYEDCLTAALEHKLPVKEIYQRVLTEYHKKESR